jgi:hypothetical protein
MRKEALEWYTREMGGGNGRLGSVVDSEQVAAIGRYISDLGGMLDDKAAKGYGISSHI